MAAVQNGNTLMVEELLQLGASPLGVGYTTMHSFSPLPTPLHNAVAAGNLQMARLLGTAGLEIWSSAPNVATQTQSHIATPLMIAARRGDMDMVVYLVEECKAALYPIHLPSAGASSNLGSPLAEALHHYHLDVAQYLVGKQQTAGPGPGVIQELKYLLWRRVPSGNISSLRTLLTEFTTDAAAMHELANATLCFAAHHNIVKVAKFALAQFGANPLAVENYSVPSTREVQSAEIDGNAINVAVRARGSAVLKILLESTPMAQLTSTAWELSDVLYYDIVDLETLSPVEVSKLQEVVRLLHVNGVTFRPCRPRIWSYFPTTVRAAIEIAREVACRPWTSANLEHEWMPAPVRRAARTATLCMLRCGLPSVVRRQVLGLCSAPQTATPIGEWLHEASVQHMTWDTYDSSEEESDYYEAFYQDPVCNCDMCMSL